VSQQESALDALGWRRNPGLEKAPLQGELMLFDPATSKFFVLNRTMAFLWDRCDGDRSLAAVAEALVREFSDVEPTTVGTDLRKALGELIDLGLVVRS
jgi:hypothetical protein